MARRNLEPQPVTKEARGKDDAVFLTPNRLVLLLSLRQAESFQSQKAWAEATQSRTFEFNSRIAHQTLRIVARSGSWNLLKAIQRLDGTWVQRRRQGPAYRCTLTRRGRDIAEGRVKIRVIGLRESPDGGGNHMRTRAVAPTIPQRLSTPADE